jgi:hypothetical protein
MKEWGIDKHGCVEDAARIAYPMTASHARCGTVSVREPEAVVSAFASLRFALGWILLPSVV